LETSSGDLVHLATVIRVAGIDDVVDVERVRLESWRAAYRGLLPDHVLDGLRLTEERVAFLKERHFSGRLGTDVLVADVGGETVGMAVAGPCRDEDLPGLRELYALYVLAPHWGEGLGHQLIEACGPVEVTWVLEGNTRARRFYERQGFAPDGTRKLLEMAAATHVPEVRYRRSVG
jgi:GNAT superfamily N-acetyltransferase